MQSRTCPACHATYPLDFRLCPHDGSLLQPDGSFLDEHRDEAIDPWPPGKVIGGKYVVFARSGEDEVAWVYRARSLDLDEPRSLRALRADLARDARAAQEFRRTARLMQKLVHPNLPAIEAWGDAEDGRPFLVTEVVEGTSLTDLMLAEGPIEPLRACSIARQIAAALAATHQAGMLHLGLSPSQVLLCGQAEEGRVQVLGFGTASVLASRGRVRHAGTGLTLRGLIPPCPQYTSPEQALGKAPQSLDARSDLYSLGVLMHQMLTGRLPFWQTAGDGGSPSVNGEADLAPLVSHLEDAPLPVSVGGRAEPPAPLVELVAQLLEKRPELRPATASAVIEKIRLAEDRIAARAILGVREPAKPRAASPVRDDAEQAASTPLARAEAGGRTELPSLPAVAAQPATLKISEPSAGLAAAAPPSASAPPQVAVPQQPTGPAGELAAASAAAKVPVSRPSARRDSTSVLFKAQPPEPTHWGRWVLASLSVLVVAAGVWFFLTRGRTQWLGSGPLSPIKSDELRTVEGANAEESSSSASKSSSASQPAASSAAGSTSGAQNPVGIGSQGSAPSAPQPSTPNLTAGESSAGASGGLPSAAKRRPVAMTPGGGKPAVSPQEVAAEVKRAVSAGDVFFELGQYDLAIQAYEGPLKLDPDNGQLRARIQRAQSAKSAEQEYLEQQ